MRAVEYWIPRYPSLGTTPTYLEDHGLVGVATNGVEFTTDPLVHMFDSCVGHIYLKTRAYHYHLSPLCVLHDMGLVPDLTSTEVTSRNASSRFWPLTADPGPLVGYALDGFGIYAPYDEDGVLLTADDLDECNGRTVGGEYRYYILPDPPYVPSCLMGNVIGRSEFSTPDPLKACPRRGRNVTYVPVEDSLPVQGHQCMLSTTLTSVYLVGISCWESGTVGEPASQTIEQLRSCGAVAGFGVLDQLHDGSHMLKYMFDDVGNANTMAILESTAKTEDIMVSVSGTVNGSMLMSADVAIMGEAISFTGHLIDMFCWDQPNHVGIDGTDLRIDAPKHANWCMRDVQVCRDNGFGVLEHLADGTYDLKYEFDEAGNANALTFVDTITKYDDIIVTVSGFPVGKVLQGATMVLFEESNKTTVITTPAPSAALEDTPASCESDMPEFDSMFALDGDLTLYWTVETSGAEPASFYPAMRAALVKRGGGYASLGFSYDAFMSGSEAIIGEEGETPAKYTMSGRTMPSRMGEASQTLVDAETRSTGSAIEVRFTKQLAEDGEIAVSAEGSDWGFFLWGHSSGGLSYHGTSRGALTLDLSSCAAKIKNLEPVSSSAIKAHGILMCVASRVLNAPFK